MPHPNEQLDPTFSDHGKETLAFLEEKVSSDSGPELASEANRYGDKAQGLDLLEKHYSSPVRNKNLTIQAVKTYYVMKGEERSIPLPSEEKPLICRSSFIGEDEPGNSGRALSFVVTKPEDMDETIEKIIQSYPKNCQSQSVVIQAYVQLPNESAGVITFEIDTGIMRIDSLNGEGCEAIVNGTKPTDLTLYDGKNLLSNAHFNKEVLADLYSEMKKLAKEQDTSFLIEYVMDETSKELYVVQFKPLPILEEKSSYIDPKYLTLLEQQHQRLIGIKTIVSGNNALLEENQVSHFQNIEAAHYAYFTEKQAKNTLCIINEMPLHSMGSHYATNFQAAGITVMYAPPSLVSTLLSAQGKNIVCSPQQQELFIVPAQSVIEKQSILPGKLRYLIPEKNNYRMDVTMAHNFLGRSITHVLELQENKESNILRQMQKRLSPRDYTIWSRGFKENTNFYSLINMLYEHNLLATFFLLFGNRLEQNDINKLSDDMKDEFIHLNILTNSEGLFQDSKSIEALQQDYCQFERICEQLNEFLFVPERFNAKFQHMEAKEDKSIDETCQQMGQYVYTVVLFKSYIEYMDGALKRLASNSQRNHPEVFEIFCKVLKKFCEPNHKIKKDMGANLSFSPLDKTVYDGVQTLNSSRLNDNMIAQQYECFELKKDATPKTAAELWTTQHHTYNKLCHLAIEAFLFKRAQKNLLMRHASSFEVSNSNFKQLINFPEAILKKLNQVPVEFFYPQKSEAEEHTVMTVEDKLVRIFDRMYSLVERDDCLFLKAVFKYWDHGFVMILPISMNDSINAEDFKIYYYSQKPGFSTKMCDFAENNPWFVIAGHVGDFEDWQACIIPKIMDELSVLKQIPKEQRVARQILQEIQAVIMGTQWNVSSLDGVEVHDKASGNKNIIPKKISTILNEIELAQEGKQTWNQALTEVKKKTNGSAKRKHPGLFNQIDKTTKDFYDAVKLILRGPEQPATNALSVPMVHPVEPEDMVSSVEPNDDVSMFLEEKEECNLSKTQAMAQPNKRSELEESGLAHSGFYSPPKVDFATYSSVPGLNCE